MKTAFSGKTALVTGAGSGIGRHVAITLARQRARVVLAGRRQDELERTGREIDPDGRNWLAVPSDVTDEASVCALIERAQAGSQRLDIAVNVAGVFRMGAVDETEVDAFRTPLDTNVVGTWTGQHVMPAWRKSIHPSGLRNWRKSLRRCFGYVPRGRPTPLGTIWSSTAARRCKARGGLLACAPASGRSRNPTWPAKPARPPSGRSRG